MAELLGELNNAMDNYHRMCWALDRTVRPYWLTTANISLAQNHYNALVTFQTRFAGIIEDFANGLLNNNEGESILPVNGEPGYH